MFTVHAICRTHDQLEFDIEELPETHRVYSIPVDDYCAIVSTAPDISYAKLDRREALEHLLIHQRVVESVMPHGALIPLKFGTALPEEEDVVRLILQTKNLIEEALEEFEGKVQMEVSILWDTSEVFLALSHTASVVEMKERVEEGDEEARLQLGIHVKQLMDEKRHAYAADILPHIDNIADSMVVHPVMADEVILNIALLIDADQEDVLDHVLERIDHQYEGKFSIRCMGPMPLYSFTTLKARKVSYEVVAQACELLELPSSATIDGIKRAYRKKAQLSHPDLSSEEHAREKMPELTAAYNLLTTFAESQLLNVKVMDGERCHFDEHTVENTLLISFEKHTINQPVSVA